MAGPRHKNPIEKAWDRCRSVAPAGCTESEMKMFRMIFTAGYMEAAKDAEQADNLSAFVQNVIAELKYIMKNN